MDDNTFEEKASKILSEKEYIEDPEEEEKLEIEEAIALHERLGIKYDTMIDSLVDFRAKIEDEIQKDSPQYSLVKDISDRYMLMLEQKEYIKTSISILESIVDKYFLLDNGVLYDHLKSSTDFMEVLKAGDREYILGENVAQGFNYINELK